MLRDVLAPLRAAGVSPFDATRETDPGRFADRPDAARIVGTLHRAHAELDGPPVGGPIDVAAAPGDMLTDNGDAPLTCLA